MKYRPKQLPSSQLETLLSEAVKLSSQNLVKAQDGTITEEDVIRLNETFTKIIALTQPTPATPRTRTAKPERRQVHFNFNGESFDAFEILGLPDFVPLDFANAHYEKNFADAPIGERVIYEYAIETLKKIG